MSEPSPRQIAWIVARDVNRTFGGGFAAMELLRRSCTSRGWLDATGHALLIAVSRVTPGTNLLAYCAGLGWTWRRFQGATIALLAASLPCAAIISVLAATLARIDERPAIQLALGAATVAASLLVLSSAWQLLRPHLIGPRRIWMAIVAAIVVVLYLFGATPVRILLAVAVWGALTPVRQSARARPAVGSVES
jgi:chromate transporter